MQSSSRPHTVVHACLCTACFPSPGINKSPVFTFPGKAANKSPLTIKKEGMFSPPGFTAAGATRAGYNVNPQTPPPNMIVVGTPAGIPTGGRPTTGMLKPASGESPFLSVIFRSCQ